MKTFLFIALLKLICKNTKIQYGKFLAAVLCNQLTDVISVTTITDTQQNPL